ncbi:hypothetical protein E5329_17735 [Petralouisia muris]|uniref:Uncharacterized protein n=1 Tax=Petralouisia muris TaxID=3032872 RepID=A0AC61RTR5_9FIRM|nr:AAA family ATPase [Petralouisia muris]TGY93602.1 hypothetical protein E5329_17735 [Petralouisia muris]
MRKFKNIIEDIKGLIGIELSSLSGIAAKITVTEVNEEESRVIVSVAGGDKDSRSFEEFEKISAVLLEGKFAHVDSILNGSGSSRNRPETILASLPYIEWAKLEGKKYLAYVENDTHPIGTIKKMTDKEIADFKKRQTCIGENNALLEKTENEYKKAAKLITDYISQTGIEGPVSREEFDYNRELFLSKFAPEKLKVLQGNDLLTSVFYTMGNNTDSLCCWIEMNKDCRMAFGSIAGGSAYKFGLFQRKETGIWTTGSPNSPQELSEEEALVLGKEIRDALVKGTEIIKNKDLNTLADYEKLDDELKSAVGEKYYNWAWFHKYYSIVFPEKLSGFHSPEWQKHALRCFLIQPSDKYYARSGQLAMIQNYAGLHYTKFISALRERFSPNIIQFVRLGTSDDERNYAGEWKKRSVVGIGWSATGSLEEYTAGNSLDKTALAQNLTENYYSADSRTASRKAGELIRFYDTDTYTVLVTMDGERLYGLIDEIGAYFYDDSSNMAHLKTGKWHTVFSEDERMPEKNEGLQTSCVQLKADKNLLYLYEKYFYAEQVTLEEEEQMKSAKPKSCLELERNPRTTKIYPINFIVYGAPGTGKTYSMVEYALGIIDNIGIEEFRTNNTDRKMNVARYKELVKAGQIVFTTFHQNYGYEEFIQGLRPDKNSSSMAFKTVDGVFKRIADMALNDEEDKNYVIIIDEINRANISKVFGELITLIEEDKRWGELNETSVTLQSGDQFAVPNNLYIVGTMNSADKSISLIDAALRRRFAFIEQRPTAVLVNDAVLRSILENINLNLVQELDSTDLLVGHSYFMGKTEKDLCSILNNNIIPLLYEYFYDNRKKVANLLQDAINKSGAKVEIIDEKVGRLRVKDKVE